jgi:hypothetical protein
MELVVTQQRSSSPGADNEGQESEYFYGHGFNGGAPEF